MGTLKSSYCSGISKQSLLGHTIGQQLDITSTRFPEDTAIISKHQEFQATWSELRLLVDEFAAGLLGLGLDRGERIGIWSPNNLEWTVVQFAAAKAGLILVNINPAYRISELEYALKKVQCKALVTAEYFKSTNYIKMLYDLIPELETSEIGKLKSKIFPNLNLIIRLGTDESPGMLNYSRVPVYGSSLEKSKLKELSSKIQFDDPVNIQFTSGTTGYPKGATLTHHNILNNGYFNGQTLGISNEDKVCIPVPLYHCFGMVMGNLMCLAFGATMVYPSAGFEPREVLKTINEEKCTILYGVPTMFIAELDHPDFKTFDLSSLRSGTMAGSTCPIEIMKRVMVDMNMEGVTIAYGMTETSPVSFQSSLDDSVDKRVSTVGRVHPHVEVKVVDDDGAIVPIGVTGELLTRGYSVMLGYWDDIEKTEEAVDSNGWMHTGDLATIDIDGFCRIVGRSKDMVIRGGENIYPREIEEFFFRNSKIKDVQVIGVPDERYGEELCVWIKLHDGENSNSTEMRSFCEGKIAHFKIPRYVEFVDSFPMTVTGKIQKYKMREIMIKKLDNLSDSSD